MPTLTHCAASAVLGFGILAIQGCTPKIAPPPKFAPSATVVERQQAYQAYALKEEGNWFTGYAWVRQDGEYALPQLGEVVAAYPETQEISDASATRGIVIGVIAGLGGGVIGYTAGSNLMEGREQIPNAMYAVGGGLIGLAVITGLIWSDPAADLEETYNRELARSYGVAPSQMGR